MKKVILLFAWLCISTGVILTGVAGFQFGYNQVDPDPELLQPIIIPETPTTADLPPSEGAVKGISSVVEEEDSRAVIVANFLERYNSPMEPHDEYGKKLVEIADRYNIDFRLLPAIAMQESNLCKKTPKTEEGETYNCLGFGVHSRGTLGFDSYEAGFERAAKELKANYIDIGLTTPEEIMSKYTPSSTTWDDSVNQWMAEMRYDDRSLGKTRKTNADLFEFVEEEPQSE